MTRYLLDTNACIYLLKRSHPALAERVSSVPADDLAISVITLTELWHGAAASSHPSTAERLRVFVDTIRPISFDSAAAKAAGEILADLRRGGSPIGAYDTLIAGHALALGATLVTHNAREFRRVKGLNVEDWVAG